MILRDLGNQGGKMLNKRTILDKLENFKIIKRHDLTNGQIELTFEFPHDEYTFIFGNDEFEMIEKEFKRFINDKYYYRWS